MSQIADQYPDLSSERLETVANRIACIRNGVSDVTESLSHCGWGFACTACEATMKDLLVWQRNHSWLRVLPEQGMAYTILIGKTPLRVQPESAKVRPVMPGERQALSELSPTLSLFSEEFRSQNVLRLEVAQRPGHRVARIAACLIEMPSETLLDSWTIYDGDKQGRGKKDVTKMNKGRPPQNAKTDNIYELRGARRKKSDESK